MMTKNYKFFLIIPLVKFPVPAPTSKTWSSFLIFPIFTILLIIFRSFKDGIVTVQLKGSCSGCPSSIMTLKQGVQNLLCHYIPEVKSVEAI